MNISMLTTKTTAFCAALIGAAALTYSPKAEASDFGFSVRIGNPRPVVVHQPPVVVQTARRWVPERYETRSEQVLVRPERHERQWVSEVVTITRDRRGREIRNVTPGFWHEVCIPAVYETRTTTVKIPGYWEDVTASNECHDAPVAAPVHHHGHGRPGLTVQAGYNSDRRPSYYGRR